MHLVRSDHLACDRADLDLARRVLNGAPMKITKMFAIAALASAMALGACSKKGDDAKKQKLAGLCVQATDMLKNESKGASDDAFRQMITNGLMACSGACDAGDDPSCKTLDSHLEKLCKVSSGICGQLCETADSKSLKEGSCKLSKK